MIALAHVSLYVDTRLAAASSMREKRLRRSKGVRIERRRQAERSEEVTKCSRGRGRTRAGPDFGPFL
ncbi:MAG: hypothetical protein A3H96_18985 [Acidobacteria bacterium RIFCSPLOWO2_02_FULL_67_36]|nr:MAG: hypothetical protein A3H96_18985 [Acidobacteria bacterium RIFCSPLOWO2_02_FULL_67_36]OFW20254.1 MAG: hypothetical protein A3G21_26680 [Acidobacteria bacterium RIFCSPLOWO2_12_FULL_66_21]